MKRSALFLIAVVVAGGVFAEDPVGPDHYAIVGAQVHVGNGSVIDGGTVVIADGLIAEVGTGVAAPAGVWTIDAAGKHVYPGFVDAFSDLGIKKSREDGEGGNRERSFASGPEDRPSTTTWRSAADELTLDDDRIETWRDAGFTSAVTAPTDGIFPGQAAFVNLGGSRNNDLVVATPVGVVVNLEPPAGGRSYPGSLMGVVAYVHQTLLDAAHYRESLRVYEASPLGKKRPRYDRALEPLVHAQANGTAVLFPAILKHEIERVVELAEASSVRPVLYGGHEAHAAAALLKDSDVPVLIDLKWPERSKDADPDAEDSLRQLRFRDEAPGVPAALEDAGVVFAFYAGELAKPGDAIEAVRRAVESGLSSEGAVQAMALSAASIFGVDDRTGSVEAGKIANLFIADGNVFEEGTRVHTVFVDGVKHEVRHDEEETTSQ